MGNSPRVYLAGPDIFRPDAVQIGRTQKAICAEFGFEGLFPLDNDVQKGSLDAGQSIYRANIEMMRAADLSILNLTPFRGPSADAGTVFELGYLVGRNLPVFAYTDDPRPYKERVAGGHGRSAEGWIDDVGDAIEDFGLADNLMIVVALAEQGHGIVRTAPGSDLFAGLRECLRLAFRHFNGVDHAA